MKTEPLKQKSASITSVILTWIICNTFKNELINFEFLLLISGHAVGQKDDTLANYVFRHFFAHFSIYVYEPLNKIYLLIRFGKVTFKKWHPEVDTKYN